MASLVHVGGGARVYKSDGCGTIIKIHDYGKVDVFTGSSDIGQGSETVLAQIVSEVLGIPVDDINVINNDTDVCPWDVGVHASRTTSWRAIQSSARPEDPRANPGGCGGRAHEDPSGLDIAPASYSRGMIRRKTSALGKVLRNTHYASGGKMFMAEYFYDPPNENFDREFKGNLSVAYAYGAHGVEVEVDRETGCVKIINYVAAHDVGRALNAILLEGQISGGGMMGLGYALSENMIYKSGKLMNANYLDYKIPTAKDVPAHGGGDRGDR